MVEIIIIIAFALYVLGIGVCGVLFMNDYTAQVDFLFWLLATLFWPVTWWYIWIRVHNDDRERREDREAHRVHTGSPCEHCGREWQHEGDLGAEAILESLVEKGWADKTTRVFPNKSSCWVYQRRHSLD